MLRAMRNANKTWVMRVILGFLALTFVAFFGGVGGIGGGGGGGQRSGGGNANVNAIVQVGDLDIDARTISTAFSQEIQSVSQALGTQINIQQAIQLGLLNRAVSGIVTDAIYRLGAADIGVSVSDSQVASFIRTQPQFQGDDGFDAATYEGFLRQNGLGEGQFLGQLRQDLERTQLLGTVQNGSNAPFTIVETINNYRNETRVFEGVVIGAIDVPEVFDPTEAELDAYYAEAGNNYLTPEYRRATVVSLTPEQYASQVTVSEADIEREFDTRRTSFVILEERELSQIVFATEAEAQAGADALTGGSDFATVAEGSSAGAPISLGQLTRGELLTEMTPAFDIAEGETTAPVQSPLGWHLIHVDAVYEGETPTIDDVRDELIQSASLIRARDDIFEVMDAIEDSLAGGSSLAVAGAENGVTVREIVIAADGTTTSGDAVDGFSQGNRVLSAIFSTAANAEAQLNEDSAGGFFSVVVKDIIPPEPMPFEEIRDDLAFDWQDQQIQRAAQAKADTIVAAVAGGLPFAEAAADADLPLTTFDATDRSGEGVIDLPSVLIADLFAAGRDEVRTAPVEGGVAIARVADIIAPTGAGALIELQTSIQQAMAQDLQIQLAEALRANYSIDIDEAALDNLITP